MVSRSYGGAMDDADYKRRLVPVVHGCALLALDADGPTRRVVEQPHCRSIPPRHANDDALWIRAALQLHV